jgi:ABC-type sugar transport system ATPase subunit
LQGVTLDLAAGEVHCVAGENGAGKSTLIKVLTGAVARSSGDYELNGSAVPVQVTPMQIRDMGIGVVYQELSLFPELSVLDNLMMGEFASAGGVLRNTKNARIARSFLERLGLQDLPLETLVQDLPTATRQLVGVARALGLEGRLVIFDEPTSALSERDSEELLTRIKILRDQGVGVLYVTHRIEEMFEIGDCVSVLRDGILVETKRIDEYTLETLVETMVGRPLARLYPGDRTRPGKPVLELKDLEVGGFAAPINVTVHAGEIVGIAGLLGSGRSRILRAIFGADRVRGGSVLVNGLPANFSNPGNAARSGLGLLTEDRKESGILPELTLRENVAIAGYRTIATSGWLSNKRVKDYVEKSLKSLRVKYHSVDDPITALSGGNQQKALIARWLAMGAKVLLLDEPTKGVDVGAKADIYAVVSNMARNGMGFLVVSSYLPEVLGLCDRIIVVKDHAVVGDVLALGATEESIMHMASIDTAHKFESATPTPDSEHPSASGRSDAE